MTQEKKRETKKVVTINPSFLVIEVKSNLTIKDVKTTTP
jgi:hypothetical protein